MDDLKRIMSSDFKIWKSQLAIYSKENLEKILSNFCKICGPRFFFMDYYQGRLILDTSTPSSSILGGYSKEFVEEKGFGFFEFLLDLSEREWMSKVNDAAYDVFLATPIELREDWVLTFDLAIKRIDGHKVVLRHRLIPYKLCDKGHLWISLCYAIISGQRKIGNPTMFNKKTNEHFEYINGRFVKKELIDLSDDERLILDHMIKGFTGEHIAMALNISESSLRRKKYLLYQRVGVNTNAELVHWAHTNGII